MKGGAMKKILGIIILVLAVIFLILLFKAKSGKEITTAIKPGEIKKIVEKPTSKQEIEFLEQKTHLQKEIIKEEFKVKEEIKEREIREIRLKDISQEPDVLPEVSLKEEEIFPEQKIPTRKELEEMGKKGIIIY